MEAIAWGNQNNGFDHRGDRANHPGSGAGPWVQADLESGVWGGNVATVNPTNTPINTSTFVTAMLKGRTGHFTLKGGDAESGRLKVLFDGPRPPHYTPMDKRGAIVSIPAF